MPGDVKKIARQSIYFQITSLLGKEGGVNDLLYILNLLCLDLNKHIRMV